MLAGIFIVIGIVVGIFFASIMLQRIAQKHVHLLHMRSEAKRYLVRDLAQGDPRPVPPAVAAGTSPQRLLGADARSDSAAASSSSALYPDPGPSPFEPPLKPLGVERV